jgi:hypothetical protein
MKNKSSNVIWVDFKTGRKIDLNNLERPQKPHPIISNMCKGKYISRNKVRHQ